ncbi:MAG: plasmid mobilization protein MobA [Elusimicrobiota bacterium]|jgi:hypothetical protein
MSSSESRKRTVNMKVRLLPEEDMEIRDRAHDAGLTVAQYLRCCALNRRIRNQTDRNVVNELRRLGGLQKHLFGQVGGLNGQEYARVFSAIIKAIERIKPSVEEADDDR